MLACGALAAHAHVGSPDIYLDAKAGPYQLFITIRPPTVIPGVAELAVRSETAGVHEIRAVPMPMMGDGAKFAPIADRLTESKQDPQFFTGSLWMMAPGSWQVRISADGQSGTGQVNVPVPSAALGIKPMQPAMSALLTALMAFLVFGVIAIAGATVREAKLKPGVTPHVYARRRSEKAMIVTALVMAGLLVFGKYWWDSEAQAYSENIYKPLQMRAMVTERTLTLRLSDPGWLKTTTRRGIFRSAFMRRTVDDFIPDHNHLMHLYAIREPNLDVVYHLHPEPVEPGVFQLALPTIPSGRYELYADVVHRNGFPETLTAAIELPNVDGRPLSGDDAKGTATAWRDAPVGANAFVLPDGYRMEWLRPAGTLHAKEPMLFRFRLLDRDNAAPSDMALYMGMPGHAAFVKTDGTVFAHIHPTGSVSMAAFMLAQQSLAQSSMADMNMAGMDMAGMQTAGMESNNKGAGALTNEVTFPYGFPAPGRYRIFVQMKHGGVIETGVFDAKVER